MNRMNRKTSILTLWAAALVFTVALLPNKSFAHNTSSGCGSGTSSVKLSDENNWVPLCSKTIDLTDGVHNCVAMGSAEVKNTVSDVHNQYRFTVSTLKNPPTGQSWERILDINQDVNSADPIEEQVSTVRHFKDLAAGTYTFYWLGRPFNASADQIDVTPYSMGVVCTDNK